MEISELIFKEIIEVELEDMDCDNYKLYSILRGVGELEAEDRIKELIKEYREDNQDEEDETFYSEMTDDDIEDEIQDEIEEAITNSMDNIINIFGINTSSLLYNALILWYGNKETLMENIRSAYEDKNAGIIYYVTGTGYDLISNDLLGGSADGTAKKVFLDFINEKTDVNFKSFHETSV